MRSNYFLMSGLDRLLAKSLDNVIKENLGDQTVKKIERRLFEKYGMSLINAMEEFHKVDAILREIFGAGADQLEKRFLENICSTARIKKGINWIQIEEELIINNLMEAYADEDKKKILNTLSFKPKIVSEVLASCKIPQTSGYRKINSLISNGLLIVDGFITGKDGKRINKYKSIFENIRISIEKDNFKVEIQVANPLFKNSSILQVILGT